MGQFMEAAMSAIATTCYRSESLLSAFFHSVFVIRYFSLVEQTMLPL